MENTNNIKTIDLMKPHYLSPFVILLIVSFTCATPDYGSYFVKIDSIDFTNGADKILYVSFCQSDVYIDGVKDTIFSGAVINRKKDITCCDDSCNCIGPSINNLQYNRWYKNKQYQEIFIEENGIAVKPERIACNFTDTNYCIIKYNSDVFSEKVRRIIVFTIANGWRARSNYILLPSKSLKLDKSRIRCDSEIDNLFWSIDKKRRNVSGYFNRGLFKDRSFYEKILCDKYNVEYVMKVDSIWKVLESLGAQLDSLHSYIIGEDGWKY